MLSQCYNNLVTYGKEAAEAAVSSRGYARNSTYRGELVASWVKQVGGVWVAGGERGTLLMLLMSLYAVLMSLYAVLMSLYAVLMSLHAVLMSLYAVLSSLYAVPLSLYAVLSSLYLQDSCVTYFKHGKKFASRPIASAITAYAKLAPSSPQNMNLQARLGYDKGKKYRI